MKYLESLKRILNWRFRRRSRRGFLNSLIRRRLRQRQRHKARISLANENLIFRAFFTVLHKSKTWNHPILGFDDNVSV